MLSDINYHIHCIMVFFLDAKYIFIFSETYDILFVPFIFLFVLNISALKCFCSWLFAINSSSICLEFSLRNKIRCLLMLIALFHHFKYQLYHRLRILNIV